MFYKCIISVHTNHDWAIIISTYVIITEQQLNSSFHKWIIIAFLQDAHGAVLSIFIKTHFLYLNVPIQNLKCKKQIISLVQQAIGDTVFKHHSKKAQTAQCAPPICADVCAIKCICDSLLPGN